MSNWIVAEVDKFKQWVKAHCESTNAKLAALEQRVAALEGKKVAKNEPPASPAP